MLGVSEEGGFILHVVSVEMVGLFLHVVLVKRVGLFYM